MPSKVWDGFVKCYGYNSNRHMICLKLLSDNKSFAQFCGFQVSLLTPYKDTVNVSMTNSTGGSSTASGYV